MAIIKDIDKGNGEIVRVEVSEFKGQNYLNLRIWYTDKESGSFKPTQKGVALRPDLYGQLKEAILAAETALFPGPGVPDPEDTNQPSETNPV